MSEQEAAWEAYKNSNPRAWSREDFNAGWGAGRAAQITKDAEIAEHSAFWDDGQSAPERIRAQLD